MEKIIKKLFITGVVLTAAGILALPVGTHAADYTCTPSTTNTCKDGSGNTMPSIDKTSTFSLTVGSILEIKNVTGAHIPDASISTVNTDNLSATVATNYKSYVIQLSAEQTDLVLQGDASKKIPPSSTVTGGVSGWGIRKIGAAEGAYTAITSTPTTFFTSNKATTADGTATDFNVGIGVSPTQAPGTYGTEVTVTAIAPASLATN